MALDKNLFRNWIDGDVFSARDYVYERNTIIDYVNGLPTVENVLLEVSEDYYDKEQLDDGQLDNRYFTETELTSTGVLDGRYYREGEVDAEFLADRDRLSQIEAAFGGVYNASANPNGLLGDPGAPQFFNQRLKTTDNVEFASVKLGANTVNEAFIDGLEDKYTQQEADDTFINQDQLGVANGVATLDGDGRLPASQLPINTVVFRGTFGDGVGDLPSNGTLETGDFYICVSNGYESAAAGITFDTGDKAVYDGTGWSKIDNTETVTGVKGSEEVDYRIGNVSISYTNVGAAAAVHTHVEADITDLDKYTQSEVNTLLAGKSDTGHTHVEADITDLDKYTQEQVDIFLAQKAAQVHTHFEADITDLDKYTQQEVDDFLDLKLDADTVGVSVAPLVSGEIPSQYLPSFVDDVLEYADFASFPATGTSGKIYVAQDTGKTYRWGVTQYIEIAANEVNSVNGKVGVVVLSDEDIAIDASGFNGVLTTDDTDLETALATINAHSHSFENITDKPALYTEGEVDALLANKVDVGSLTAGLTFYPTTTYESGGDFDGYAQLVTSISDSRYNDSEVILYTTDDRTAGGTSVITSEDPLNPNIVGRLIADAGVVIGDISGVNTTTIGQVIHEDNSDNAKLRYKIFKSSDMVNPIAVSGYTDRIENEEFIEIFQSALIQNTTFAPTDRFVIHYEAYHEGGSDSIVGIKFGGQDPTRTLVPVPLATVQSALAITYDPTSATITATNLQDAVDELDALIQENTSVIKIQRFVIVDANTGSGTFTYTYNGGPTQTGNLVGGQYQFPLEDDVEYILGQNRLEIKVNNNLSFYSPDTEIEELNTSTVGLTYILEDGDEVFIKVYQGLDSVALNVPDGTITTAKLSQGLQSDLSDYETHINSTANPHGVTKTQVGLGNVTNDAQVKSPGGSTDGYVPTWVGDKGDALAGGYGVQTTLSSSTTDLVRADAIFTAIDTVEQAKQDTLVSGTNIKTLNGSSLLGSGNYEIDIPSVDIASTPPTNPNVGDLWWNDTDGVLYIYYNDGTSSQWVSVSYADVEAAINNLVANAPEALDTLNELAAALGDDPNFATTIASDIAAKADQADLDTLETSLGNKADKNASISSPYITADYSFLLADKDQIKVANNSNDITLTVPANDTIAFPVGSKLEVLRRGSGNVTLVGESLGIEWTHFGSLPSYISEKGYQSMLNPATDGAWPATIEAMATAYPNGVPHTNFDLGYINVLLGDDNSYRFDSADGWTDFTFSGSFSITIIRDDIANLSELSTLYPIGYTGPLYEAWFALDFGNGGYARATSGRVDIKTNDTLTLTPNARAQLIKIATDEWWLDVNSAPDLSSKADALVNIETWYGSAGSTNYIETQEVEPNKLFLVEDPAASPGDLTISIDLLSDTIPIGTQIGFVAVSNRVVLTADSASGFYSITAPNNGNDRAIPIDKSAVLVKVNGFSWRLFGALEEV